MTTWYRPFPAVERLLVATMTPAVGVHVLTELPHDFQDVDGPVDLLPVVQVDRISGTNFNPKLDRPVVAVDAYGATRGEAQDLAEACRSWLNFELPGQRVAFEDGFVVVTKVDTIVGPRLLPHANPAVRRYSATYEILLHPSP
jgi:hypothetical protein